MSISTILLLLLVVGISMYSKINKTVVAQSVPEDDSADDVQEEFFGSEEDALQEKESSYFTYESEYSEKPVHNKSKGKSRSVASSASNETTLPQFDLRQAVIGQVILSNNYINEINQ